jgi:hypothetical protein
LGSFAGLVLCVLGTVSSQGAKAADLYTVRGVHVDVTAASASEARSIAQAKGQRDALGELMRRLTLAADWGRLPQVDDPTTQDAVRGFQVASEKASSTRYIADLNVSFRPDTVRNLLKRSGILFGETQAKPALLLPIYDKGGAPVFWEDDNPWREAVERRDLDDAITPLMLPLGDVQEFGLLTAAQAMAGDKAAIADLGHRYGADEVVVAVAASKGGSVGLTVNRYGLGDAVTLKRTYQGLDDAAAGLIAVLGDQWKRDTIVEPGSQAHITASASFATLDQWEAIRKALGATPLVNGLQVEGITAKGAEVQISYRGTPEKLALSLAQSNVNLIEDTNGWILQAR